MDIYPSILDSSADTSARLLEEALVICGFAQLDVADGMYVQNKTAPLNEVTHLLKPYPHAGVELHLMVDAPEKLIQDIDTLNRLIPITRILIHMQPAKKLSQQLQAPDLAALFHHPVGLVINPEDTITQDVLAFPAIQIMTIHPGKQGTKFIPETLSHVSKLKRSGFTGTISLDGGINDVTLSQILAMPQSEWPDAVCPGSYVRDTMSKKISVLKNIVTAALQN